MFYPTQLGSVIYIVNMARLLDKEFGSMKSLHLFWLCFALFFAIVGASASDLVGRVVGVHDGDTITVLDASKTQNKILLSDIDAPELKQAFGTKSKQSFSDLVYNTQVTVEWTKRDKYDRIVGKVLFMLTGCLTPAWRGSIANTPAG